VAVALGYTLSCEEHLPNDLVRRARDRGRSADRRSTGRPARGRLHHHLARRGSAQRVRGFRRQGEAVLWPLGRLLRGQRTAGKKDRTRDLADLGDGRRSWPGAGDHRPLRSGCRTCDRGAGRRVSRLRPGPGQTPRGDPRVRAGRFHARLRAPDRPRPGELPLASTRTRCSRSS